MGVRVWVLSHQDDRLLFRPWGSGWGQHWPAADYGDTHTPHGVGLTATTARLCWTASDGHLHTLIVDDRMPIDLTIPLEPDPIDPPIEPPIEPEPPPIDPPPTIPEIPLPTGSKP